MNHAKKMLLIDPDTLGRLQQRAENPVNNNILSLDQEMERILKLQNLTDDEKWSQYKQVLARFLHFTNELRQPISLPIIKEKVTEKEKNVVETKQVVKNNDDEEVKDLVKIQTLQSLPRVIKNVGELLYDSLNSAEIITWDNLGSVSVRGEKVHGSSIIDLISNVVRNRKDTSPQGWEIFANVLSELNVPQEYIGNARRKQFIQQLQTNQQTPASLPKAKSIKKE